MLKEKKSIQRYGVQNMHGATWCLHVWEENFSFLESRAKEIEERLLTACKEDLLKIAEYEKPEEINTEQQ